MNTMRKIFFRNKINYVNQFPNVQNEMRDWQFGLQWFLRHIDLSQQRIKRKSRIDLVKLCCIWPVMFIYHFSFSLVYYCCIFFSRFLVFRSLPSEYIIRVRLVLYCFFFLFFVLLWWKLKQYTKKKFEKNI